RPDPGGRGAQRTGAARVAPPARGGRAGQDGGPAARRGGNEHPPRSDVARARCRPDRDCGDRELVRPRTRTLLAADRADRRRRLRGAGLEPPTSKRCPANAEEVTVKPPMAGWIGFAALIMIIVGVLDFFEGLIAVARNHYYVISGNQLIVFDTTTWGWV